MRRWCAFLAILFTANITTGCWDRIELSERAFDMGAGADLNKDGSLLISAQFIVPFKIATIASGGENKSSTSYFVETGIGKTTLLANQNMQSKLSRLLTRGHRRNYFIGEKLALNGISNLLDSFSRDPLNRIRMDFWVVKGDTALNALRINYPLEKISSSAVQKIHQSIGGQLGDAYLEYVEKASAVGSNPTLPVIQLVQRENGEKTYKFYGRALFNDQNQLAGYLGAIDSAYRLWILGKLKYFFQIAEMNEENDNIDANVGVELIKFDSKLHSTLLSDNKIRMDIKLAALGRILENNTSLDLNQTNNLKKIEDRINKQSSDKVQKLVSEVQKKYKLDVLGFNDVVNRNHPYFWNKQKNNWKTIFPEIEVHVQVRISLKQVGLIGPSLQKRESELIK